MSMVASQNTGVSMVFTESFVKAHIKWTSKLGVTGFCEGNPPVTGEFPSQNASNAENVSVWRLFSAKPLPDANAKLLFIGPSGRNFSEIRSKYKTFHSRKCILKCHLRSGGHFVQGERVKLPWKSGPGWSVLFKMFRVLVIQCIVQLIRRYSTLRPRQNGRHFTDDIFKCIFLNENARISLKISLKFVPTVRINNIAALVQIMAWCRPGDKPLSEPMMISLLTHICVTRPQWDNYNHYSDVPWGSWRLKSSATQRLVRLWFMLSTKKVVSH